MIVKMFKPQFAPLVRLGQKHQTVRPIPKRMPKVGDPISCREWIGKPYRSKQRILCESVIVWVAQVTIDLAPTMGCFIWVNSVMLGLVDASRFANADGFESLKAMGEWFTKEHGLPFSGILIKWE